MKEKIIAIISLVASIITIYDAIYKILFQYGAGLLINVIWLTIVFAFVLIFKSILELNFYDSTFVTKIYGFILPIALTISMIGYYNVSKLQNIMFISSKIERCYDSKISGVIDKIMPQVKPLLSKPYSSKMEIHDDLKAIMVQYNLFDTKESFSQRIYQRRNRNSDDRSSDDEHRIEYILKEILDRFVCYETEYLVKYAFKEIFKYLLIIFMLEILFLCWSYLCLDTLFRNVNYLSIAFGIPSIVMLSFGIYKYFILGYSNDIFIFGYIILASTPAILAIIHKSFGNSVFFDKKESAS